MPNLTLSVTTTSNTLTLSGVKSLGAPADLVATATPAGGAPIRLGTLPALPDGPYSMTATVAPGTYTVEADTSTTISGDTTSTSTVAPAVLTATGNNTLGSSATIAVTATPAAGGSPLAIGTLTGQPVGPYSVTAAVPPGSYLVDEDVSVPVCADVASTATVSPATLTVTGNNTLGIPADIVVTATPSAGGHPITIGTLTQQPVGAFSLTATVPSGNYTVDTAMSATVASDVQASATVPPTALTVTGSNALGVPANVLVTATPQGGGSALTVGTLTAQPPGPFSVTTDAPPGVYTIDVALTGTLSSDAQYSCTVPPPAMTVAGNNSLGVPANIVVTASPVGGGAPITMATLANQPVGAYAVTANVPAGTYTIDMAASATLAASATATATVTAPDIVATVTYNGANYTFAKSTGTSLGDYTDPQGRFVHDCVMVANTGLPSFRVFFRSDKQPGANRDEVVFELGDIWTTTTPFNMTAYGVTIVKGGATLATLSVPQHFFRSRWRWQSTPRPVTTTVASLIASGLLPHYDKSVGGGFTPASTPYSYSIMGLAGIYPNMCVTGERPDIGPVTEWQADYICTGSAAALSTLLAQLEASGTIPWHLRDEKTGAPIDVNTYPKATMYSPSGAAPYIPSSTGTGITPDQSHEPALACLPFLLTGDSYALEELQFAITWNIVRAPYSYRSWFNLDSSVRANAWSLRSLAQAATLTPAAVPPWLKPQSYFQTLLNTERDWLLATFVNSSSPACAVFQTIEETFGNAGDGNLLANTYISPWQEDFEAFVLGWVVQMGHSDWAPIHQWKIQQTIARTNGASGWIRAQPTLYHAALRATAGAAWQSSWSAAWALNLQEQPANMTYSDPNSLGPQGGGSDYTYPSYALGALAMADRLGITAATPCHTWLGGQILSHLSPTIYIHYKWCIS